MVSQAACDRMPIASALPKAAKAKPVRVVAATVAAWAPRAAANPTISLRGRAAVNQ